MRMRGLAALVATVGLTLSAMLTMGQGCVTTSVDSDGDGYTDNEELTNNPPTDPSDFFDSPAHVIDSDGDGCSDYGETAFGDCDGNPSTPPPSPSSLSGSISIGGNLVIDGDTSDPNNSQTANDFISSSGAQTVPNPCAVGGFLGTISQGTDERDVYLVAMAAGQSATLFLADPDDNDFDLFLYDETGSTVLDSSEGVGKAEQVTVPENGLYLIEVRGYSVIQSGDAGGLYSLLIGESTLTPLTASAVQDRLSSLHPFVEGEVLVKYTEGAKTARANLQKAIGVEEIDDGTNNGGFHRLRFTTGNSPTNKASSQLRAAGSGLPAAISPTIEAIKALRRQNGVERAEPNYIRKAFAVPNDEFYHYQWHYRLIGLPAAWDITTGNSDVIVAVVDTGVALGHPDLAGRLIAGYDFITDVFTAMDGNGIDPDPDDPGDSPGFGVPSSFHGTHVSGTIAARSNNTLGVAGVAWNAQLMPLRVLGRAGEGTDADIAQAVRYAAGLSNNSGTVPARRADIINMSLGGPGSSNTLSNAIAAARQAGVIVITAAGNNAGNADNYFPGAVTGVVNVSAVDQSRQLASYSNFGTTVAVCAPGGDLNADLDGDGASDGILSTLMSDDGRYVYAFYDGTSMAAPHVAGVAALMKSVDPDLSPLDFDRLLAGTHPATSLRIVDELGIGGRDTFYGYGLINARNAVRAAAEIAGSSVDDTPVLRVLPQDISFGSTLTAANVVVSNVGGGTLSVTGVTSLASWISVSPTFGGEGTYQISVSRSGLAEGVYSGGVSFISNGGSASVAVRMNVGSVAAVGGNVGTVYVLLVDPVSLDSILQDETNAVSRYAFSFANVPRGQYRLYAGSDMNNDGFIDDEGEAFGGYPVLSNSEILSLTDDVSGLAFSASYQLNVQQPTAQARAADPEAAPPPRIRRLR